MFLHVSMILFPEGVVSQHALQVSRPTPRGKLRGLVRGVSRPTSKGELEGSGLGGSPDPHPGGSPGPHHGGLQAHTQGGVSQHALRQTPNGYCCGQYASYWNAFLFLLFWRRQMLTSQMGIVAKNGGVDVATAFLRHKITIAITV